MGPVSAGWLADVGIATWGELETLGAVAAYERVKAVQPTASLNLLYGLAGVMRGVPWTEVTRAERAALRAAFQQGERVR